MARISLMAGACVLALAALTGCRAQSKLAEKETRISRDSTERATERASQVESSGIVATAVIDSRTIVLNENGDTVRSDRSIAVLHGSDRTTERRDSESTTEATHTERADSVSREETRERKPPLSRRISATMGAFALLALCLGLAIVFFRLRKRS